MAEISLFTLLHCISIYKQHRVIVEWTPM